MPQWGNQDYKKAVFEQLAQGSGGGGRRTTSSTSRTSRPAPRGATSRAGWARRSTPSGSPPSRSSRSSGPPPQKMQPNERSEIAQDLMEELHRARARPHLAPADARPRFGRPDAGQPRRRRQAGRVLPPEPPRGLPAGDGRQAVPRPLADKPLVAGLVGVIAGKLINRAYDR